LDFSPPWVTPAENHHVALEVKDLKEVRAYLESKNAEIRHAVPMPDRDRFYLIDPFGTYFEVVNKRGLSCPNPRGSHRKGWCEEKNSFRQRYGSDALDASTLLMPLRSSLHSAITVCHSMPLIELFVSSER
jgi:hypothetical protein